MTSRQRGRPAFCKDCYEDGKPMTDFGGHAKRYSEIPRRHGEEIELRMVVRSRRMEKVGDGGNSNGRMSAFGIRLPISASCVRYAWG